MSQNVLETRKQPQDIISVEDVSFVDPVATVSDNSMDSSLALLDFVLF